MIANNPLAPEDVSKMGYHVASSGVRELYP